MKKELLSLTLGAMLTVGAAGTAAAKVEGDTIILGSSISLTGKYATNGLHTQRGYDYAVDVINAAGGVKVGGKSYKLAVKYYDDESTPARGAQLAERLIQQDGVDYMLGPYSSGMVKAIAPVSEKFGVPMVEAEGASRSLFTQGYKYLFAVLSTSEQYLATAIDMAAASTSDPKSIRVAMAFEGDPFSMDVRAGVVDKINEYGMKTIIDDQLPADLSDMSTTLTKVKALKPDILIVSGHSKGAATAARQIDEMKVNVPMIAMTHCEAAKVQEKFPKTSTGFLCPTQWVETLSKSDPMFGSAAEWNAGFKKAYPSYTSVPYQSAQASAAVYVWKEAFEAANSFDKDTVRDAIAAVEMETFYGDIKFSENGNNIAKPMFMRQIGADSSYSLVEKFGDMTFPRNVNY
ncbi:amino acid ABC transporter substrate-binding protein [Candidatus Puniceispirillum marinum]|uniref:Leu/Ile/Val-binding protein n=1 Tax=Puniceispirillum marinum (strain IMCC1322) TaxID=488538 RepID=D5BTV4_PUNMI|nr:amino acid ABC transporter substrate-binding protein [Candidatus Puniceispirillum marinum]ADE39701.1 Leu/Ile/Val-binding protein precursor [Candidatus Puniceispirillum marinum IMCC1322]